LNIPQPGKNITSVMTSLMSWLSGHDASDSDAYQTVMKHVGSEDEGRSLALRLLIHYYGDIHQPLHNVGRYTKEYPSGDKGGNAFELKNHYSANELHAVWDNVIYKYHTNPKRPFSAATWSDFGSIATDLVGEFSFTQKDIQTIDYIQIGQESYNIAITAYDGLTQGHDEVVPDSYIQKFQPIAAKRVVLAANRLVYAIEQIFGAKRVRSTAEPFMVAQQLIENI
jgi:hypothetical protein